MQIYTKPGTSPSLLSKKCCPAIFKQAYLGGVVCCGHSVCRVDVMPWVV